MRNTSKQMDMLNGSLIDKILIFSLPLAASSILQQLFNSVDVAVVGRFASSEALAAVGSTSSVINLLINLFVGVSVGTNVAIANYIGQNNRKKIRDTVHTSLSVAILSGIFLLFLGIVIAKPILELIDTPDNVLDLAVLYLRIYFVGVPFIMIYNFGAAILRSKGDTKRPLYCLIISGIINACLNLLLVVVFHLSVSGVAIATVISNIVSAGMILYFLIHEQAPIHLYIKKLYIKKEELIQIFHIGIPAGLQGMVFSVANVCIQSAINSFGSDAVAGSAVALNYESFAYFIISAFSQATVTFISQNYGAGQFERCKKVFNLSIMLGALVCGLMSIAFVVWRGFFIRIYTTTPEVIEYASVRITHILTFEFLTSTYEIGGAALRAIGYSMTPALFTVLGSCVFRLIWVYTVFRKFNSFEMLMDVYPISWIITGTAVLIAYFYLSRKLFSTKTITSN